MGSLEILRNTFECLYTTLLALLSPLAHVCQPCGQQSKHRAKSDLHKSSKTCQPFIVEPSEMCRSKQTGTLKWLQIASEANRYPVHSSAFLRRSSNSRRLASLIWNVIFVFT